VRWLIIAPILFIGIFYVYPLIVIFREGFAPDQQFNIDALSAIFASDYYRSTIIFTFWQAALSTLLTLLLALPSAYAFVRFRFPGKSVLSALIAVPFVMPTVVTAAAFISMLGSRGLVNTLLMEVFDLSEPPIRLERTLFIILLAHVFYNYAVAHRILISAWSSQSRRFEEAAAVLGAHGWQLWWHIRLPLLRPAILSAAALIFTYTFTSFGVIVILGGARFATIEVEIYQQVTGLLNLPAASALSLLQMACLFIVLSIYTVNQRRMPVDAQSPPAVLPHPRRLTEIILVYGSLLIVLLVILLPIGSLLMRSFMTETGFSLDNYLLLFENRRGSVLFTAPIEALRTSLGFALSAAVLSVSIGAVAAQFLYRMRTRLLGVLDSIIMLPLATSAVTLGFGYLIAFDAPPFNFRSSIWLVPIIHALVAIPFVVRSILPALQAVQPNYEDAAKVLGASPWMVWRWVQLPLISRGLFVGAAFAFAISLGEFGASVFIARPESPTLPIAIFRLLGQPGASNYGQALAMSAILMSICGAAFLIIERFRKNISGVF
jgi:thiamine transport system permease protein